jgi:hypothetical protein
MVPMRSYAHALLVDPFAGLGGDVDAVDATAIYVAEKNVGPAGSSATPFAPPTIRGGSCR